MGLFDALRGKGRNKAPSRHHLSSGGGPQTEEDQEQIEALWEESAPTGETQRIVEQFQTTTQALRALATHHADNGDPEGAALLHDWASRFSEHEAFNI